MNTRLFNTKLTIERHTGGGKDANNNYVDNPPEILTGWFSVQPFGGGNKQEILPEGISNTSSYVLFGKTPIKEVDQFAGLKADIIIIDGFKYVAHKVYNWTYPKSKADHFKTVVIKEDVLSQRTQ